MRLKPRGQLIIRYNMGALELKITKGHLAEPTFLKFS